MTWVLLLLVIAVGLWWGSRRRRKEVLSGRVAAKPTYSIEPPTRRMGRIKDGLL